MQPKLNVSLRQIAYFKAIGEVGSFRGAAERRGHATHAYGSDSDP